MQGLEHLSFSFLRNHPKDAARYLENLPTSRSLEALLWVKPDKRIRIIETLSLEKARTLVREMSDRDASESLKEASPRFGAAILQGVEEFKRESILRSLPSSLASSLGDLLEQSEFTLAPLMETKTLTVTGDMTVSHALDLIKKSVVTHQKTLFVLNGNRQLVGMLQLRDILASGKNDRVEDCMSPATNQVNSFSSRESLLQFIDSRELTDIPVVDEENVFLGFIPFSVCLEEITRHLSDQEKRTETGDTLLALGEVFWIGTTAILDTMAAFSGTKSIPSQSKGE